MGTTAIISGILALLASVGGIAGSKLSEKSHKEAVNGMAVQDTNDSGKGVSIASDITGLAAQALSFASGFGTSDELPHATRTWNKFVKRANSNGFTVA